MSVTVLGSGTCVPSTRRSSPALLVSSEGKLLLLDIGSGTLRRLAETKTSIHDIDLIFLSHFHPDHCADLVPFLFATKYAFSQARNKELHLAGGPGLRDLLNGLQKAFGRWIAPEGYPFYLHEAKGTIPFGNFSLKTLPLTHSDNSIGIRIESPDGKAVVYSGDTDYCKNIVHLGNNADLLILECSLPEEMKVEGHLTPSLAGRIARESRCKRLLLTHFYPPCDEHDLIPDVEKEFAGEIIPAEDLMEIRVC
ncbi:MAG: ribonuclease Z [Proteobacteria bacterium]|nr:ribonuclease Z [Pseudomonadota bacterium]